MNFRLDVLTFYFYVYDFYFVLIEGIFQKVVVKYFNKLIDVPMSYSIIENI